MGFIVVAQTLVDATNMRSALFRICRVMMRVLIKVENNVMRSPAPTLPSLNELLLAFEHAFRHHTESRPRANGGVTVRLTGMDVAVRPLSSEGEALGPVLPRKLAEVAAFGLATALTDPSLAGTRLRMELITTLAKLEASVQKPGDRTSATDDDPLLTTAEAAALLGMSRPHVSMLCDQRKLGEVIRSEGGHRRIRQSAVVLYKQAHAAAGS